MKKKTLKRVSIIIIVVLVVGIVGILIWWNDDAYQTTPELALNEARKTARLEKEDDYIIANMYDTVYFDEGTIMLYLSKSNKVCCVSFPYSKARKKYVATYFGWYDLSDPFWVEYLYKERTENVLGLPKGEKTVVSDITLSERQVYVNGEKATTKRFEVPYGELTYNLQFWYMELGKDAEFVVEYRDN